MASLPAQTCSAQALTGVKVLTPKAPRKHGKHAGEERFAKLGRLHWVVFSPDSKHVVGYLVKRPDVVGLKEGADVFVRFDALTITFDDQNPKVLTLMADPQGVGPRALRSGGIDLDSCILWLGMDARFESGEAAGIVEDAEFLLADGTVRSYFLGTGAGAAALIGRRPVDIAQVKGYSNGAMVVAETVKQAGFSGGAAEVAGAAAAKAAEAGKEVAAQVGARVEEVSARAAKSAGKAVGSAKAAAGEAVGSTVNAAAHSAGKLVGAGWAQLKELMNDDEDDQKPAPPHASIEPAKDVVVGKPVLNSPTDTSETKVYEPVDPTKATSKPGTHQQVPQKRNRAAQQPKKKTSVYGKMFGDFAREFKKASK